MVFYLVTLCLSILFSLIYVLIWHEHFDVHFTLIFTFIPIANLGFFLRALSFSIDEALVANDIIYLGGCFLMLFIMMCVLDRCDMKFPREFRITFFIITMIIYASVIANTKMPIFYTEVTAEERNGMLILQKEYGFMHTVFYCMIAMYFLISISVLFISYTRKNNVPKKVIIYLSIPLIVTIFAFFGSKLFPTDIEPVPAAYCFSQFFFLLIVRDICLYDVKETHMDSLNETGEAGFISFDNKLRYLGSNEAAVTFFPELKKIRVDTPSENDPFLEQQVVNRIHSFMENPDNDTSFYSRDGHTYLLDVNYLYDGKKKRGFRIFVRDDTRNQEYISLINRFNTVLKDEVDEKTAHIAEMHDKLIMSLAVMVESRDNSTGGHIKRTSEGVRLLVDEMMRDNRMHITPEFRKAVIKAAPMHDLGKIAVDDSILRKPGRFEPWEFEIMKTHAAEGGRIVHEVLEGTDDDYFRRIAENVATYHHERWDGSGYPEGLSGLDIPLEARIMAIADVYDALVSKRVYKESMSFEEADRIIMEGMGKHFDKRLEPYYVAARPKLEAYYSKQNNG